MDDLQISCLDYSDCAGNSVGPERAQKKIKGRVDECILVSCCPFFLLAIQKIPNGPGFIPFLLFLEADHRILSAKI